MPSPKPIRVAHILPRLTRGGAEAMVLTLMRSASPAVAPLLVCLKPSDLSPQEADRLLGGLPYYVIGQRHPGDPFALLRLVRLLRAVRPDIIHTHLFGGDLYGTLAARLAGISRIVSTEHSTNAARGLRGALKRWLSRSVRYAVAVSSAVRQSCLSGGLPLRSLRLIHNGIDTSRFVRHSAEPGAPFHIGTVGRLSAEKNQLVLIEAVAALALRYRLRCSIVGEGEERALLEKAIREKGLSDRIVLLGARDDVPVFLGGLDAFVLPSLWEGLPLALLEAGACGLPCLAADIPAVRDVIVPGSGILFDPRDAQSLARALEALLLSPDKGHSLGLALQKRVREHFDSRRMALEYEKLYRAIYDNRPYEDTAGQ